MLVMRSAFAILCQIIYLNRNLKKAVWDGINRTNSGPLIVRSSQGSITNIINYSVTKFLPLTMIAIVNNLGPPITVLCCFLILKEKLKLFEMIMVALTVAAILVVVIGGTDGSDQTEQAEDEAISRTTTFILFGILFINPFLSALGTISMRKMKKFHEAVVSWYLNWSIGLTSLIVVLIMGSGFKAVGQFDAISWLLSFGTGFTGVSSQTSRFIALRLQKAAKLQKLQPLTTLWQFCFDVFLFKETYTLMQYLGLVALFAIYVFQGLKFLVWDLPRSKKRQAAKLAEIERIEEATKDGIRFLDGE